MAEAEDVITDAARHATVWARALWRRHRPAPAGPPQLALADVAERLDLLLTAVFGHSLPLRMAQPDLPLSLLQRWMRPGSGWPSRRSGRHRLPLQPRPPALPCTNGEAMWLPPQLPLDAGSRADAVLRYRVLALRLAVMAQRGAPGAWVRARNPA
ncbi:MAG TPA: hypothetical protein PK359_20035, partial [Burkholderiaceae bacterium]|nr:hypothetical protein [Burkholderiaceae bacterium]